ncbi:MAG: glycosyltransferase family 4 protein [Clostridia bacterium]|nr:glycosyltransferase family 4 protein [Clostridia bacterium]
MKKIVIVANDVAMPGEKGLSRLHYLAEFFTANGFDTELVTADFQHWEKRYRTKEDMERIRSASSCKVTFIHEGAYTKNIDPKRILSYRTLTSNIEKYLEKNTYDLVYALIPDNHLCAAAGKYAKRHGLPFIIDVEDLWPEAMRMVLDVPALSDVMFSYFTVNAKKAYSLADAVVGSSDEYRDEPLKYGCKIEKSRTVYVGTDLCRFDEGVKENAGDIIKPDGEFWVTYAGTLGTSYDIETLIKAADILKKRGTNIKIMLLGSGPLEDEFKKYAASTDADVHFAGYLPYPVMAAYLTKSDITVNSLVAKASQSIVSKIGDYLAAGLPMINTGLNAEFKKKVESDGFGVNVEPENAEALADAIETLYKSPELREEMGKTARRTAETQFNRPVSYMKIVELARELLEL